MPGQTALLEIPYPVPADAITDYPALGQDLAELLEAEILDLAYAQITAPVTVASASEAAPTTIVTLPATTFDGESPVVVEFFAPRAQNPDVSGTLGQIIFLLWDDTANVSLGRIAEHGFSSTNANVTRVTASVHVRRKITPAAGARTLSIRAYVNTGSGVVTAGTGGAGAWLPAYARIVR